MPHGKRSSADPFALDWRKGGKYIQGIVLEQAATPTRWATNHQVSESLVNKMIDGRHNFPFGPTCGMLWDLALKLTENDAHAAQLVVYHFLELIGALPKSDEVAIAQELARAIVPLHASQLAIAQWIRMKRSLLREGMPDYVPGEGELPET